MRDVRRGRRLTKATAEAIAAQAFVFLAEDSGRLRRFLADTGLEPDDLRQGLGEPSLLAAVLGHIRSDESALLAFAANAGLAPEDVASAEMELGGGSPWEST
jgi:hypothetical protein